MAASISLCSDRSRQPELSLPPQLEVYERLLQGVAAATNCLLTTLDFDESINQALLILGEATRVDRIYIFETHPHSETHLPALSQRWEWAGEGVTPEINNPDLQNLMYRDAFPRWYETLSIKEPIVGFIQDFPDEEREVLEPQGILSILVVPIFIQDHFWGFVGFDQCQQLHEWTEVEISTLWAIAGSIGGHISRYQAETSLQQLNADLEQRIDKRTHALIRANRSVSESLQKLKKAQTQLIHTEKMSSLGQLVAGIAHEINNPASFIRGNLQPAQQYATELLELVDTYQSEYPNATAPIQAKLKEIDLAFLKEDFTTLMASMKTGTRRIESIVKSLRTFSRIDESECKTVDIHHGLDSTLHLLTHRLKPSAALREAVPIAIIKHYANDAPLVKCYPGALNQVFMTLLGNAIDAIHHRLNADTEQACENSSLGKIEIHTGKSLDADTFIIRITDNGTGIEAPSLSKIFDPFFTTKPVGQGTGLGLSIAHQIVVQQHQGRLKCQSTPGQGASFTLELPFA